MLPLELIEKVYPPEGQLFVERLEMPARRGLIILPWATKEYNRAAEAVVLVSRCEAVAVDVKVVLAGSVSRSITFGYGENTRTLWLATPDQIEAYVTEFPEKMIERGERHVLDGYTSADHDEFEEAGQKFDEGDSQGLR